MRPARRLLRSVALVPLFETFLVSAVISVLVIRAALALSGFPQLGGGGLHIAHMLWGGLLMLLSLLLLFGFVGRAVQFTAAMVSGIGFGTFIDEIGKFVTSDNDYFFRPAVALIYAVFVLLSLLARALEARRPFTDRELLANAFDLAREIHLHHRRPAHSAQVLASLSRHESGDPLVGALRQTLEIGISEPPLLPGPFRRLQRRAARFYLELVRSRRLHQAVLLLFVVYALFVATSLTLLVTAWWSASLTGHAAVARAGAAAADLLSLVMIAIGAARLRRSRSGAYRWLERAVMVNLLVSQVFTFYLQQFGAIAGLAIDLILLVVLNGMIRTERRAANRQAHEPPSAHPAH
ncbi:MAG TPA: hypothetical protein VKI99_20810 [Candidatus Dormibacteraeota bacterium]|nr:hypothetical protein [Candidatus Dormibacteraeota bacterium]